MADWIRIDDSHNLLKYHGNVTIETHENYYNGTRHTFNSGAYVTFSAFTDQIRVISCLYSDVSDNVKITIDEEEFTFSTNDNASAFQQVVFEKTGLENKKHDIKIENMSSTLGFVFDAVEINAAGFILPELTRDYEFPIKIGNKEDVETYSASLIGGEEQLLICREGDLYLTDGDGSYISCGSNININEFEQLKKDYLDLLDKYTNLNERLTQLENPTR